MPRYQPRSSPPTASALSLQSSSLCVLHLSIFISLIMTLNRSISTSSSPPLHVWLSHAPVHCSPSINGQMPPPHDHCTEPTPSYYLLLQFNFSVLICRFGFSDFSTSFADQIFIKICTLKFLPHSKSIRIYFYEEMVYNTVLSV